MRVPNVRAQGGVAINMTPMIDIVFLLIIFFLVSSHLAKQENRLKLDLPNASTALDENDQRTTVTVNVTPDGKWQMGGHVVDERTLRDSIGSRKTELAGELRVRIRTDRNVPYEQISPLLKACGELGISDLVFAVYETKQEKL